MVHPWFLRSRHLSSSLANWSHRWWCRWGRFGLDLIPQLLLWWLLPSFVNLMAAVETKNDAPLGWEYKMHCKPRKFRPISYWDLSHQQCHMQPEVGWEEHLKLAEKPCVCLNICGEGGRSDRWGLQFWFGYNLGLIQNSCLYVVSW